MTVDDVVFSLNRAIESSFTAQTNGCMDHFEKVDDSHVKAVLKYAYAPFIEIMTNPSYSIVSERAVKECEAAGKVLDVNQLVWRLQVKELAERK